MKNERNNKKRKSTTATVASVASIPPVVIKTEINVEQNMQVEGFYDEWEHETQLMMENSLFNGSIEQETTITQSNDDLIDQLFFDEPPVKTPQPEPNHSKKSSPIASDKSPKQIQLPIGCQADILDSAKREQLAAQKKLLSTLFVTGLPIDQNDHVILSKMFMDLCHHIHVCIDSKEIASIGIETVRPNENNLVVQLNDPQQKENIVRIAQRYKGLKASEFIPYLPMNLKTKIIHVYPKLTKFYERLRDDAIVYLHNRKLYSFRVCSQGLAVRCSKDTQETYIKSRKELENLVSGASPLRSLKRVYDAPLDSTGPSSPKQARMH